MPVVIRRRRRKSRALKHIATVATVAVAVVGTGIVGYRACAPDAQTSALRHAKQAETYAAAGKTREALLEYKVALKYDARNGEIHEKFADLALRGGDVATALREYARAADLLPDNDTLQIKAGSLLLAAGQFHDASARADRVLARKANHVEATLLRAYSLVGVKDLEGALAEIQDAIASNPERGAIYTNIGAIEMSRGRREVAEDNFKKAVTLAPNDVQTHLALANFYWLTAEWALAEQELKTAVKLSPTDQFANRCLGTFYLATNRIADAEAPLNAVVKASQASSDRLALADYYLIAGKPDRAKSLLAALALNPADANEAETRLAIVEFREGQSEAASARLDTILSRDPRYERALLVKARLRLAERRYADAIAAANAGAQVRPSATAYMILGISQMALNQGEEAAASYAEVIRLNPRATDARLALAKIQLARNNPRDSLNLARDVLRAVPDNQDGRLTAARAMLGSGDLKGAEAELTRLVKAHPQSPMVHASLGSLYGQKNQTDLARKSFEEALRLAPRNGEAIMGIVALDLLAQRNGDAKARVDRLLSGPVSPSAIAFASRVYSLIGESAKAEILLKDLLTRDPQYGPAYAALGELYLRQDRLAAARAEYEVLATKTNRPLAALTMIGMLLEAEGKTPEAIARYKQALGLEPKAVVAANNLAWLYAESRTNLPEALALATGAYATAPKNASVCDTYGYLLMLTERQPMATEVLQQAVNLAPDNPVYRFHLGKSLVQLGQDDRARTMLNEALKNPKFKHADEARQLLKSLER